MSNRPCLPPLTTTTPIRKPGELVNAWKVIVPTLVIFIAGIVTGLVVDKFVGQQHPAKPVGAINQQAANPWLYRNRELLKRMDRELDLTPDQHKRIASDMADSQKRVRFELQQLHLAIAKELTPEQRKKFESLTRPRMEKHRNATNSSAGAEELTPEQQKKSEELTRQQLMEKRRNSTNSLPNTNSISTNTAPANN